MPGKDITRKRCSRAGYIRFINKIIKSDLQTIYDDYNNEHLLKLESFKNILEEKLNNVMKLFEEIHADLEEEDEFTADFEKYTDIEVSIRHDIAHLKAGPPLTDFWSRGRTIRFCTCAIKNNFGRQLSAAERFGSKL